MKFFKTIALLSTVCCVCATNLHAQGHKQSLSFNWGVTIPANGGFVDKTGFVNPSLEWSYRVLPFLSAGASLGYGYNSDKGEGDENFDGSYISGMREKSLAVVPLMLHADFFPCGASEAMLRPYLGVGVGIQHATFEITGDNIVTSSGKGWAESFSARVGTRICPPSSDKLFFDVRALWQHAGNDWSAAGVGSVRGFGITIGAGFTF